MRLVYKRGSFLGFVSPQKSSLFQFDWTIGTYFALKDPQMLSIWVFFETHNSDLPFVALSLSSQSALKLLSNSCDNFFFFFNFIFTK